MKAVVTEELMDRLSDRHVCEAKRESGRNGSLTKRLTDPMEIPDPMEDRRAQCR